MTKGIIVIDIPESCVECPCFESNQSDYDGFGNWCGITGEEMYGYKDKRDCPIKELPEKQVRDYPEYDRYITGYDDGWDACIDEILGE